MKLTLKKAVTIGELTVGDLTFREEICAGDLRGIPMRDPMHFDDIMKIAGRLCGQPSPVMDKLSFADMQEVIKTVSVFIDGGQPTGRTGSES